MSVLRSLAKLRRGSDFLRASTAAREVRRRKLTYLSWRSLRHLEEATDLALAVPGAFIECGVALGGSAVVICSRLPEGRVFHGYDVFSQIPEPSSPKDGPRAQARYATIASGESPGIEGDVYYGYLSDLEARVRRELDQAGVGHRAHLHRGPFAETLVLDEPVALAHVDCDWYDSVRVCLERIYPVLQRGGYLVCDDYHHYDGASAAVDELLGVAGDLEIAMDVMGSKPPEPSTSLVLRRR